MKNQHRLKEQLIKHIKGGQAFSSIDVILNKIFYSVIGIVTDGLPYSFYQQFFHIREAQLDSINYCRDEEYVAPEWPDEYWTDAKAPDSEQEWQSLINSYYDERDAFCNMLRESDSDLLKPFDTNPGHNLLREAELIIEHTAYHTGQLYIIYRLVK